MSSSSSSSCCSCECCVAFMLLSHSSANLIFHANSSSTAIIVSTVAFNLESTIARNAIFGCQTARNRTTVINAGSAASAAEKTSPIATIAACVLMLFSSTNTIASSGNTCLTVRYAKKIYSQVEWLVMKCLAGMQYIGIASVS